MRLRLEELNNVELRMIREYREERNTIYTMLRDLEGQVGNPVNEAAATTVENSNQSRLKDRKLENFAPRDNNGVIKKVRKSIPGSKAHKHREAALKILREEKEIRGVVLKKKIEDETGIPVNNMTTLMQQFMRRHPEVKKPYRGRYVLNEANHHTSY
nr:transcriptional repressor Rok [Bacillus sonorensis]